MPRGINHSQEIYLSSFRDYLKSTLPFRLHRKSSYNDLIDYVYVKTNVMLSESTLRRLLNPGKGIYPTYNTLNAVSKAMGFQSWEDFIQKKETEVEFLFLQETSLMEEIRTSDFESFKKLIDTYEGTPVHFAVYKKMVMLAVEDKNILVLSRIFEFSSIYKNQLENIPLYFFVVVLVRKLVQFNLMDKLIPFWAANEAAQIRFIEFFVDEYHLDGYFGKLMMEYNKNRQDVPAVLFYNTLMCERCMMLDEDPGKYLRYLENFVELTPAHFYPKSRRLALLMMYHDDNQYLVEKCKQEIDDLIDSLNEDDTLRIIHFLCRVFFLRRKVDYINFVIQKSIQMNYLPTEIITRIDQNELIKYHAFVLYEKGYVHDARLKLQTHNPLYVSCHLYDISKDHLQVVKDLIR